MMNRRELLTLTPLLMTPLLMTPLTLTLTLTLTERRLLRWRGNPSKWTKRIINIDGNNGSCGLTYIDGSMMACVGEHKNNVYLIDDHGRYIMIKKQDFYDNWNLYGSEAWLII